VFELDFLIKVTKEAGVGAWSIDMNVSKQIPTADRDKAQELIKEAIKLLTPCTCDGCTSDALKDLLNNPESVIAFLTKIKYMLEKKEKENAPKL
jgi:hypothetical protein